MLDCLIYITVFFFQNIAILLNIEYSQHIVVQFPKQSIISILCLTITQKSCSKGKNSVKVTV